MKKAITIRVSQLAYKKLLQLAELHGTQTEAIAFAIESLWRKEVENNGRTADVCKNNYRQ